jgi:hypothetical protein
VSIKNIIAYTSLAIAITGCNSKPAPTPKTEAQAAAAPKPEPQAQAETGRAAFQKLYIAARNWSPDSQPIKMESRPRSGEKVDGTATVWSGTFASPRMGQTRSFIWSGAVGENAPEQGITPGSPDAYSPGNISTRPFDTAYFKIDTDKVLAIANKRGGAALLKKNKEQRVKYALGWEHPKGRLRWHVIYGNSERDAPLTVVVDASTGEFVRTEK